MSTDYNVWFWLSVLANIAQLESYEMLLKETKNDDLMQYLKHQDKDLLETIITQNKTIIEQNKQVIHLLTEKGKEM